MPLSVRFRRICLGAASALVVAAAAYAECPDPIRRDILMHQFDPVLGAIQSQLARSPNDADIAECMGRLLLEQGKPGDAADWFDKAVHLDPKNSQRQVWLARALGEYGGTVSILKRPFVARRVKATYEKAAELDPNSVDARRGLVSFFAQAPPVMGGGMDKAREQAAAVTKLNPMRGHMAYGYIAERENKLDLARKEYEAAIGEAPDSAAYAHMSLAKLLMLKLEDFDRGEHEARLWLAAPPPDGGVVLASTAHYLLGVVEQHRAHHDRAREEFDAALAANPRNADARKALDALK